MKMRLVDKKRNGFARYCPTLAGIGNRIKERWARERTYKMLKECAATYRKFVNDGKRLPRLLDDPEFGEIAAGIYLTRITAPVTFVNGLGYYVTDQWEVAKKAVHSLVLSDALDKSNRDILETGFARRCRSTMIDHLEESINRYSGKRKERAEELLKQLEREEKDDALLECGAYHGTFELLGAVEYKLRTLLDDPRLGERAANAYVGMLIDPLEMRHGDDSRMEEREDLIAETLARAYTLGYCFRSSMYPEPEERERFMGKVQKALSKLERECEGEQKENARYVLHSIEEQKQKSFKQTKP